VVLYCWFFEELVGGVENKRFIVDGLQRYCMPEDVRFVVVVI